MNTDKTWKSIERLQNALNINDNIVSSILGISAQNFRSKRTKKQPLNIYNVLDLSRHFNIDEYELFKNTFDVKTIKDQLLGKTVLREKYLSGQNTSSFVLENIMKYAKSRKIGHIIRNRLQIVPGQIDKMDSVSCLMIKDAHEVLRYYLNDKDYDSLGAENAFYLKDTEFGKALSGSKDIFDLFERCETLSNNIETAWKHKIVKMNKNKILINSYPTEQILDTMKDITFSNTYVEKVRAGFLSNLSEYIELKPTPTKIKKSYFKNHSFSQYEVNLGSVYN